MNEAAVRFKKVLNNLPTDLVERKEKLIVLLEDMLSPVFDFFTYFVINFVTNNVTNIVVIHMHGA